MGTRRQSRELALQVLYCRDMDREADSEERIDRFCENFDPPSKARSFFLELVRGVMEKQDEIDALIERHARNWKLSRMSCVDRNVLRIAVYEMLYCPDIPPRVTINEAIDVGKKFGTKETGAFVNGIVDSIRMNNREKQ